MDSIPGRTAVHTRENSSLIKNMDKEFISIKMAKNMMVVGKMDFSTDKQYSQQIKKLEKGSGKTVKELIGLKNEIFK